MQHTLTPFLIRALSKTEGLGEEKRERQRETEREKGQLHVQEWVRKRREHVALISWQVCKGPASHGKATVALGLVKPSEKEGTWVHAGKPTSPTDKYTLSRCADNTHIQNTRSGRGCSVHSKYIERVWITEAPVVNKSWAWHWWK